MSRPDPRPPDFAALLARLLIRGEEAQFIRDDLDRSFDLDVERVGLPAARRRYWSQVACSIGAVWTSRIRGFFTHGTLLDARLGIRMLARQPLLTGVAMLALGLGIPTSLSMRHFTAVMMSPLPVPEGERVVGIRHWDLELGDAAYASVHELEVWRTSITSVTDISAYRTDMLNVHTGDPGQPSVRGSHMSASGFETLRVAPLMGRVLVADDEVRGADNVVVIGEELWRARFGADPEIVGKSVQVGRDPHTVVGVMPAIFRFPTGDQAWLPLRAQPADYPWGEGPQLSVFGRLLDEATIDQASSEVATIGARLAADRPHLYERMRGEVVEAPNLVMRQGNWSGNEPELILTQSLMLILLFIVCGNVGLLVLARTSTRMGEISVRTALGASRSRIVIQIFVEALVLALLATGAGLFAAELFARALMRWAEPLDFVPYWVDLTLSPDIVVSALALGVVAAVLAGVVPAIRATGRGIQANLQRTAAGTSSMRFGWGSTVLIVSEVAVSVGFLALGGIMARSFFQDYQSDLGFDPSRYLSGGVRVAWVDPASAPEYEDEDAFELRIADFQRELLAALERDPEVVTAGFGRTLPGRTGNVRRLYLELHEEVNDAPRTGAASSVVDYAFFRGLDREILSGRDFTAADVEVEGEGEPTAVLVNQAFVDDWLGGRNPLGQRFRYPPFNTPPEERVWYEIVGVVGPFGANPLNATRTQAVYHPMVPGSRATVNYMVEVSGDPSDFVPRFRHIVATVDPSATVANTLPVLERMRLEIHAFRAMSLGQLLLSGVAFLLSLTGLYALMSFTVAQRTREIGIRTALGAGATRIISMISLRAGLQLAAGLALGSAWGVFLLQDLNGDAALLPIDIPATIALTVCCAASVGALAALVPTLRGLRIQPTEALRSE